MNSAISPETSREQHPYIPASGDATTRDAMVAHLVALAVEDIEDGEIDVQTALRLTATSAWLEGYAAARQ